MKTISTEEFEFLVQRFAEKNNKSVEEVRAALTPDVLRNMGYQVELTEEISRAQVRAAEEAVIASFDEKFPS